MEQPIAESIDVVADDNPEVMESDASDLEAEIEALESSIEDESDIESEDQPEDLEFVEVEYEGEKYHVPPELKNALLRQKDYTLKTQEVSEQRKALEQQQMQFQQAFESQQRNLQGHAELMALESQLQQYEGVDFSRWAEQDPAAAQQAFFAKTQLQEAVRTRAAQLQQQEAQALQANHAQMAQRLEQGKAELARDIPDWSPEKAKQIVDHGKTYGFTPSELSSVVDPRMVKVLNDALMYRQSMKQATKPTKAVKPTSKVRGKGKTVANPSEMSMDEYIKWRNR